MVVLVALVVIAVVAIAVGVLTIRLASRHPGRWRASSQDAFDCQLPAGVVVRRLLDRAQAQRGWLVEAAGPSAIRIRAGTTLFAWRKRIEIAVAPTSDVTSTVSIASSSPQLHDWGDNRRAVRTLSEALADARWAGR